MSLPGLISFRIRVLLIAVAVAMQSCGSATHPLQPTGEAPESGAATPPPALAVAGSPTSERATSTATPQVTATFASFGPDDYQFPEGINPLTGLPAIDPELLKVPAVLVSISHFPAVGRPQAGLSFAPFVYEFSITGGETRFLAAFYGAWPAPEVPITGDCSLPKGIFRQTKEILGNRVWLDSDEDGVQNPGEVGIPGICVTLEDEQGRILQSTTTDSNGYFGFNVGPEGTYRLHVVNPAYLEFSPAHVGDDGLDSDFNPQTGVTEPIRVTESTLLWDAGLYPNHLYEAVAPKVEAMPKPEVGPVRSGRLIYGHIGGYYQDSCLIYAFASPEVLAHLPHCAFVAHDEANGGNMLDIERLKAVAEDNMRHTASKPFNYASNVYSELPPPGGQPAAQVNVFFGNLDQSGWTYDPLYQAYLRYVDNADPNARGVLHADVDRLTGRQIHFENVIAIMADTDVVTSTNLDIRLDEGNSGKAWLFRNGRVFPIKWSTEAGAYEKKTGLRRPIQFLSTDGSPAPLKPGHTWVIIVTPFSRVELDGNASYLVRYAPPEGEAQ